MSYLRITDVDPETGENGLVQILGLLSFAGIGTGIAAVLGYVAGRWMRSGER